MTSSPSIDFLIRIKNAYTAGIKTVTAPSSKLAVSIASLMKANGYIKDFVQTDIDDIKKQLEVTLSYTNKIPAFSKIRIYSKPGRRMYCTQKNIPWGNRPNALVIISTSKGLINQKQAQTANIGGELIAQIW